MGFIKFSEGLLAASRRKVDQDACRSPPSSRCCSFFGAGRSEALKRFVVEEDVGKDARFWKLADSLSKLYPASVAEKRWIDGVLARKKGLGF